MLELPGYQIGKVIGKGGMATVYLAMHQALHRQVAIKVMAPHLAEQTGFSDRFMREARILASLTHQNIVTVYDVNVHAGYHYIAMEYLPGGVTLDQKIKAGISPVQGMETIRQIAAALGYAHGKGIVHRDIKPENIMYREDGSAVLTDFGIARVVGVARTTTTSARMTATGMVIGTPHYMSPEQVQGQELGPFSDIYSLGVVLYEALTGKLPYIAESAMAIAYKHVTDAVPTLPGDLAAYQAVLNRMMAKSKDARYRSCAEIIADLDRLLKGGAPAGAGVTGMATVVRRPEKDTSPAVRVAAGQSGATRSAPAVRSKPWFMFAGIAAGVVSVAAIGGYYYFERQRSPSQSDSIPVTQDQPTPLEDSQTLITTSGPAEAENLAQEDAASQQSADDAEQQQLKMEQTRLAAEKRAEQDKAEQIAMLKRQQDEQARQDKLKAEQERLRNEQAKKINNLLATGENQLANSQLKPAYDSFRSVRQLDPANRDAANGIQRVADTYLALATAAALNNDFDKANQYISSAISIAPTHPKLGETQNKVFDLRNAQTARPVAKPATAAAPTTSNPPPDAPPEKKPRSYGGF